MTRYYSENIREVIQKALAEAQTEIWVVVAWFTDDRLFRLLVQKAQEGLKVRVVLLADDINQGRLNWDYFQEQGGEMAWWPEAEMGKKLHTKSCCIDRRLGISGSYNWTIAASSYNQENVIVSDDEEVVTPTQDYLEQLWQQVAPPEQVETLTQEELFARLNAMLNFLQLREANSVRQQLRQLRAKPMGELSERVQALLGELEQDVAAGRYRQADERIARFKSDLQAVAPYRSAEAYALEREIQLLEQLILELDGQIAEAEGILNRYNSQWLLQVGDLVDEIKRLEAELARIKAEMTQKAEDRQAQAEAEQAYQQFRRELKNNDVQPIPEWSEEEARTCKQLYRDASKQIHPDLIGQTNPELVDLANRKMSELNDAYTNRDKERLEALYEEIRTGQWIPREPTRLEQIDALAERLAFLQAEHERKSNHLRELRQRDAYAYATTVQDWPAHWAECRQELQQQIRLRQKELEALQRTA